MARNPNWTEDEIVLVIDLLHRTGAKVPDAADEEMLTLSKELKSLPSYPADMRQEDFRSPNSVRLKCFNLLANEPGLYSAKNLVATNAEVWRRYWGNPDAIATKVASIKSAAAELGGSDGETDEEAGVEEGGIVLRAHRTRERRKGLRGKVISQCLKTHGQLQCAGCQLSEKSFAIEDPLVHRVFEVHHTQPLGLATTATVATKLTEPFCFALIAIG